MVRERKRIEEMCRVIQQYPILWDPQREDYKEKDKAKGRRAKTAVLDDLIKIDEEYWSSYEVKHIMSEFRGYKKNYLSSLVKKEIEQRTKSGQAVDDDSNKMKAYKHAEFLRFLDASATGNFGEDDPTTNIPDMVNDAESGTPSSADQSHASTPNHNAQAENSDDGADEDVEIAFVDLNNSMQKEEQALIRKLRTSASELDSCSPGTSKRVCTTGLKNGNKSKYAQEKEALKKQNEEMSSSMKEIRSAVRTIVGSQTSQLDEQTSVDMFDDFARSLASVLRNLDEEDALERMGEMSVILYRKKRSHKLLSYLESPSVYESL